MEQFLILSHIFCGGTILTLGFINFINRKGSKGHRLLGKVYVVSMWWICFSALSIITFYRFNAFLMVIAVLTFYTSFTGVRVLRRKKIGHHKWYDWVVAAITFLFGLGLIVYSIQLFFTSSTTVLAILCLVFGLFTLYAAGQDIKFFIWPKTNEKKWWLYQHVSAIGGSYIAAVTAFAVQNPNLFMPNSSYQWLLWILPATIGSPLLSLQIRKLRKLNESVVIKQVTNTSKSVDF